MADEDWLSSTERRGADSTASAVGEPAYAGSFALPRIQSERMKSEPALSSDLLAPHICAHLHTAET